MRFTTLLFSLALRAWPAEWRERWGAEMRLCFEDGLRDRLRTGVPVMWVLRAVVDAAHRGLRERVRTSRTGRRRDEEGTMGRLFGEMRHAVRRLVRAPGFAATVVVLLALGVGANAAVFSVLRATVLTPPDYPQLERIVLPQVRTVDARGDTTLTNWSWPEFLDFRDGSAELWTGLAGYSIRSGTVSDPGDAETTNFEFVSEGYFGILGRTAVAGRFFTAEEHVDGNSASPVVLSHAFWQTRFGEDPAAVGRTIVVDRRRYEVVGVAEPGFRGLTGGAAFWLPMVRTRDAFGDWMLDDRGVHWMHAVGKLAPGVALAQAEQRAAPVMEEVEAVDSHLDEGERISVGLATLDGSRTNPTTRTSAWLAMAAAATVLLITIANVGALLLTRARRESSETAVRLAMGAGRGRLVRERLVESLILAGLGGAAGLLLAHLLLGSIRTALPAGLLRGGQGDLMLVSGSAIALDLPVAIFGILLATVAGLLFGVLPEVLRGTVDLAPALRAGGGRGSVGRQRRGGRILVAAQVGLSVVLVVGAGLFLQTLGRLHEEQRGFDPEGLLALRYTLAGNRERYGPEDARAAFHADLMDRLAGLPGVTSTSLTSTPPLGGYSIRSTVYRVGDQPPFERSEQPLIGVHQADRRVFETLGLPILRGRIFTEEEVASAAPVVVINRTAAETFFPDQDPLGQEIDAGVSYGEERVPFRVIGVVEDVLYGPPTMGVSTDMYVSSGMSISYVPTILVRTSGDPAELIPAARSILAEMDPEVAFWQTTTGAELRRQDVADTRLLVGVLGAFALLALLVSAAGLWAVVAQAVAERRREIGVRVALGAGRTSVEGLVFRQGLVPIVGGAASGLVAALLLAPRISSLLFATHPRDPWVFAAATGVLAGVAMLATWLPARRAARVDPVEALSSE